MGLTQAHSNYSRILNLEPGTDQSYELEGMHLCVCVGGGTKYIHSCINVHLEGMMLRIMSGTKLSTNLLPVVSFLHSPHTRLPPLPSQSPD